MPRVSATGEGPILAGYTMTMTTMTKLKPEDVRAFLDKHKSPGCQVGVRVEPALYVALWDVAARGDVPDGIQVATDLMIIRFTHVQTLGATATDGWAVEVLPTKETIVVTRERQDGRTEYLSAVREGDAVRIEWSLDTMTAFAPHSGFMTLPGADSTILDIASQCCFTDSENVASNCATESRPAPRLTHYP